MAMDRVFPRANRVALDNVTVPLLVLPGVPDLSSRDGMHTLEGALIEDNLLCIRDASTDTPSMRLEETALSISACSRSTRSFCGDWRV